jgi:hypothetical protein
MHRLVLALSFVMALLGGVRSRVETEAEQIAERGHDVELESHARANPKAIARQDAARMSGPAEGSTIARARVQVALQTQCAQSVRWCLPRRSLPGDGDDDDDERIA